MGALTDETNTLKLYTSMDGEIWYVAGSGIPKPSSYSYGELCEELRLVNKKSVVRLVGSSNNACSTETYLVYRCAVLRWSSSI
jgi:hypothetical protein